jgi:hypothetical protein
MDSKDRATAEANLQMTLNSPVGDYLKEKLVDYLAETTKRRSDLVNELKFKEDFTDEILEEIHDISKKEEFLNDVIAFIFS